MLKVNIGVRLNPVLNGYLNLDLAAQPNENDRIHADIYKLDNLLDHNECDEIILNDSLDYLPYGQARQTALQHIMTKLAHGGKLIIMGSDIYEVCRLGHLGQLDVQALNSIVYGIGKKSFVRPMDNVQMVLSSGQFESEEVKYNSNVPFQYTVVMRRK